MNLISKSTNNFKKYGPLGFLGTAKRYIEKKIMPSKYFNILSFENKNDPKKSVLFITGEEKNANTYYRCEIPKYQLELNGYFADIVHEKYTKSISKLNYSTVIFYRTGMNESNKKIFDKCKKNEIQTVFSTDDLLIDSNFLKSINYEQFVPKDSVESFYKKVDEMKEMLEKCDRGLASTSTLANEMSKINKNILILRNGYMKVSPIAHKTQEEKIIFGYFSGSESHKKDLEIIAPALEKILAENDNVELWLGGWIDFKFNSKQVKKLPFMSREKYLQTLSKIHVNLMPLEDTLFNKCKSEIKFIEAGLMGIPSISSKIGEVSKIVAEAGGEEVENSHEEWYKVLSGFIQSPSVIIQEGIRSREYIRRNYEPKKLGQEFINQIYS